EHTVFALPFAYLGMILAGKAWPSWEVFFWVTLAMVAARTTGMTLNRLIDLRIDEKNPRTQNRPLLTGEFPLWGAWVSVAVSLVAFFLSAWMLNPLCFKLSWPAALLLSGYHFVKRFSFLCHFTLGAVLAAAPMGGWLAVTGSFSWIPVFLSAAVLFWVAGFDIIYSLQDVDFDRAYGLHSIPVRFGEPLALKISDSCHVATAFFLFLFGLFDGLGVVYWVGLAIVTGLLVFEHALVADGDRSKINAAFFTINGWVGILLLVFTFLEILR
ncbi:MAG: UbiA family prenyltransferase, partial [Candidatus Omnitrophica bacterium]|nr:UbiA family prenyltransferase [Candidatus Omnitrophota bacterium]